MDRFKSFTGASDQVAKKFLMHHNGDVNAAVSAYFDNPTPSWMSSQAPICRYFREGFCRDGMRCRYRHPGTGGSSAVNNSNNGGTDAAMNAAIAASMRTQNASIGKKASTIREVSVGKRKLRINHGDLSVDDNDAIVNAANKMLDHAGGLAGILVRKGGDEIQHESFRKLKEVGIRNQWGRLYLPDASVISTSSGKLPCKCILHALGQSGMEVLERNRIRRL